MSARLAGLTVPMIVPPPRRPLSALLVVVVLVASLAAGVRPALTTAVELISIPSQNLLEQVFVDVAAAPSDTGIIDRLLVVPSPGPGAQVVTVALLARVSGGWVRRSTLELPEAGGLAGTPWLIDLGGDAFAVIDVLATGGTRLTRIETTANGLERTTDAVFQVPVEAAGMADADGDGEVELVLIGGEQRRRLGVCDGTRGAVLDPVTFRTRSSWFLPELALDATTMGEFDGSPGAELATVTACAPSPGGEPGARLLAVAVADGRTTMVADVPAVTSLGAPAAGDLDGDGIHEFVVRTEAGLSLIRRGVLDAAPIVPGSVVVAGLGPASAGGDALVAGVGSPRRDGMIEARAAVWATGGRFMVDGEAVAAPGPEALGGPLPGAWLDLDSDGCRELVIPRFILDCARPAATGRAGVEPTWRMGPSLAGTWPLAMIGDEGFRRLLVAQRAVWTPGTSARGVPRPLPTWADESGRAWRIGPSEPFVLAELSPADLLYFTRYPRPDPTMEARTEGRDGILRASGWSGSDYLVRVAALDDGDDVRTAIALTSLDRFMSEPLGPAETVRIVRIPVPAGQFAANDTAAATIPLDDVRGPDGSPARRWLVTIVAINAWGETSAPTQRVVLRDLVGPVLTVAAPFVSVPWPFTARISGVTEPGADVSVNGSAASETTSRGAFEMRVVLAPWPQPVEIRAVDASGNVTARVISMVGGLDYRQLPWQVIVALLVLAAVMIGTVVEGRRVKGRILAGDGPGLALAGAASRRSQRVQRRERPWLSDERDDVPLPEIEEIPPGPG